MSRGNYSSEVMSLAAWVEHTMSTIYRPDRRPGRVSGEGQPPTAEIYSRCNDLFLGKMQKPRKE